MEIRTELLDKIRFEPLLFADVLRILNAQTHKKIMQSTLQRRLERHSETVTQNHAIVEYLKSKGYAENQIFTTEPEQSLTN